MVMWCSQDQFDNVFLYSQTGIDQCEAMSRFFKEKAMLDYDYSSKLKKLTKSFQQRQDNEETRQVQLATSTSEAFDVILKEVHKMAVHRESLCDVIHKSIIPALVDAIKDMKQTRKQAQQKYTDEQMSMKMTSQQLDKAKKSYQRASKEAQKARENFHKADADMNLSRAEIEKAKQMKQAKEMAEEERSGEYRQEAARVTDIQRDYYCTKLPAVLQRLQEAEEVRVAAVRKLVETYAYEEMQVVGACEQCLGRVFNIVPTISASEDIGRVVRQFKSGKHPPSSVDDLDLADTQSITNSDDSSSSRGSLKGSQKMSKSMTSLAIINTPSSGMSTLPRRTAPPKPSPLPDVVDRYGALRDVSEDTYQNSLSGLMTANTYQATPTARHSFTGSMSATALHSYHGREAGSLSVTQDDRLNILKDDTGNGWTLVEKSSGESGYVPTSYIRKTTDTLPMSFRI